MLISRGLEIFKEKKKNIRKKKKKKKEKNNWLEGKLGFYEIA
jgi:hypothetical protein